jgi:hypothetical protein
MTVSAPSRPRHRVRRALAAAALAVLFAAPVAVVFAQFWTARSADYAFDRAERRGVRYVGPLTELIGTLADQQSASVAGRQADSTAMQRAIAAVDGVDRAVGGALGTTERWATLRQQIVDLGATTFANPADAYQSYSEVIDTTVALDRKVGDTSNLILDPFLDAYYVMNTTLLRLPLIIVDAGRYADLAYLLAGRAQNERAGLLAQLAATRGEVQASADDLGSGLEKAFAGTSSGTLGPAMLRELDDFRTAVDDLVPRTSPMSQGWTRLDVQQVAHRRDVLQHVSLQLNRAALGQLDQLIATRNAAIARQLVLAGAALAVGLVLALLAGIRLLPGRRAPPPAGQPTPGRPPARRGGHRDAEPAAAGAPSRARQPAGSRQLVGSSATPASRRGGARAGR